MTNNQPGKKILKSKTPRDFISMTFFMCGVVLMLAWLYIKIDLILRMDITFGFWEFFLFSGFYFFWMGMKVLVSYVIVYENGVQVRNNGVINYVTTRFIHFSQIKEVRLRGKIYPQFIIQLVAEEIIFPTFLIENYKEIMKEISNKIE